jgi:hypothetical protein
MGERLTERIRDMCSAGRDCRNISCLVSPEYGRAGLMGQLGRNLQKVSPPRPLFQHSPLAPGLARAAGPGRARAVTKGRRQGVYTTTVYTEHGMAEIKGLDWDAGNVGHIRRHAVTPFEVEEVVGRPH